MKNESDFVLAVFSLGLATALKNRAVDIETTEKMLFNPRAMQLISEHFSLDLVNIIQQGTELEDIQSLMPEKLDSAYDTLIQACLSYLSNVSINDKVNERLDWYDEIICINE